ncbi:MAG: thioredoxin domain-containing protein [Solirubrobacterales bacterium]|nr:thioredoxin domain-containing protein [Solirubrobacterales bacterium]
MRSRWVPLTLLSLGAIALMAALISLSVGEHREEQLVITGTGDVQQLIGGIHQLGERLGDEDAPIMLTLFTDVQCSVCADYQLDVIDPLIEDRVRTGDASIVLKNFSLGAKEVTLGGIGVEAGADQDHGWQYMEMFMRNQDEVPQTGVNQDYLNEVASNTPQLDVTAWEQADADPASEEAAKEDADLAVQLQLTDDVVVNVQGPSGSEQLEGAPSREEIDAAIARVG